MLRQTAVCKLTLQSAILQEPVRESIGAVIGGLWQFGN